MGSSSSQPSSSTAIIGQSVQHRRQVLYAQITDGNKYNFYELFGFERYSSPDTASVDKAFRKLSASYHPDKNPPEFKEECDAIMSVLVLVRETLVNKGKKHRYDIALRETLKETSSWDTFRWLGQWFTNAACVLGGGAMIIAGILGACPTGGATLALGIGGSSLFSAGVNGCMSTWNDPDKLTSEYATEVAVGALQGAACGAIGAGAAPALTVASTVAAKVGIMAGAGAASGITFKLVKDGTDLARGKRTCEELFRTANATSYAKNALIGAVIGGAIGGITHHANSAAVADDVTTLFSRLSRKAFRATTYIANELNVSPAQVQKAIVAARGLTGLSAYSIISGYVGNRDADRLTCLPTACAKRAPNYMKLARGTRTVIQLAPLQDLAFKKQVVAPLQANCCLEAYTQETPLYRNANSALRDDTCIEEYAAFIWHVKQNIKGLVAEKGVLRGYVWRSVVLTDQQQSFYQAGRKFLWANLVSTSRSERQARKLTGNALFKISCAGTGITYCADISQISKFPHEKEVLFFPYSGFVVQEVVKEDGPSGRIVIDLETYDTLLVEKELAES